MTTRPQSHPSFENADTFIDALEQETGVSRKFLEEARPIIERAFSEVKPEAREECLAMIRLTVATQAETEETVRRSMEQARKLVEAEEDLCKKLHSLKEEALAAKNQVAAAAVGLYRWRSPSYDTN